MRLTRRAPQPDSLDRWLDQQPQAVLDRLDATVHRVPGASVATVRAAVVSSGVAVPRDELELLVARVADLAPDAFTHAPVVRGRMRGPGDRGA